MDSFLKSKDGFQDVGSMTKELIMPETVVKSFLFVPHFHAVQNLIAPILNSRLVAEL